jgi:hypothetical protein
MISDSSSVGKSFKDHRSNSLRQRPELPSELSEAPHLINTSQLSNFDDVSQRYFASVI